MSATASTDRRFFLAAGAAAAAAALGYFSTRSADAVAAEVFELNLSEAEWRKRLTPQQYAVLREEGTERPYSSPLNNEKRAGRYECAGCGLAQFSSRTKFDSGTGWPSFWTPLKGGIATSTDRELGYARVEVHCKRCGGHLGHVFDDGPKPTGKRYCMNGAALTFRAA